MEAKATQPESYKQLIRRSLSLYRHSFSYVILLSFFLSITLFIPRLLSHLAGQEIFATLPPLSPYRLWIVLINLISFVFFIGMIWHMHCVLRRKHEPFLEDLIVGLKKLIFVFIAGIIQNAIFIGLAMIIIAIQLFLYQYKILFGTNLIKMLITTFVMFGQLALLLYVCVLFIFYIPLIAIENKGVFSSLEKSVSLAWNHWWRVFSLQITPWICYLIFLFVIKYLANIDIHIFFVDNTLEYHPLWTTLLQLMTFTLFIPWVAALLIVQLKDLELRKELSVKKNVRKRKS